MLQSQQIYQSLCRAYLIAFRLHLDQPLHLDRCLYCIYPFQGGVIGSHACLGVSHERIPILQMLLLGIQLPLLVGQFHGGLLLLA